jgi:hypothetical protein
MAATREAVEARLAEEAERFDAENRGTHRYSAIWQSADDPSCNWSASFNAIGSKLSLWEMRAAMARVQAEMPLVDFSD